MAPATIENVCKSFGTVEILHGISVDVADGEFVALVGPSGCGKSTLLRLVAGLENLTSGNIRIGGTIVNDDPPRDSNIAMVFQSYALYPHKTVASNLEFSLKLKRMPAHERKLKVQRAADARALSAPIVGRAAAARRNGAGNCPRSEGIPVR